jgi:hypothetical protein
MQQSLVEETETFENAGGKVAPLKLKIVPLQSNFLQSEKQKDVCQTKPKPSGLSLTLSKVKTTTKDVRTSGDDSKPSKIWDQCYKTFYGRK